MDRRDIGRYLKALREKQGLGIRETNRRTGVSSPYLSQIERGERRPSLTILERLAPVYGVSLPQLLAAIDAQPDGRPESNEHNEVQRAFDFVVSDPRFKFGTRLNGPTLSPEAKEYIVRMYERLTGKRLLS